ncbi:MAG: hypothetical protein ABSH51_03115 [Solirubrobacteraceae bacterium]|jgi:hypothetical protein
MPAAAPQQRIRRRLAIVAAAVVAVALGLGALAGPALAGATSQFTDLVVAGNSIDPGNALGLPAARGGAGIYAGCTPGGQGYNLTLVDSTVSGNAVDESAVDAPTTPYAGTGNICAAPALAAPATGDVHETASSPTIDAGSNALVPAAGRRR